jgi:3-hydroxyacyl-CoA dehydrogenase
LGRGIATLAANQGFGVAIQVISEGAQRLCGARQLVERVSRAALQRRILGQTAIERFE